MRKLFVLVAFGVGLLLAVMASSTAAAPIAFHFHDTINDSNPTDNVCGIDGSSVVTGVVDEQDYADGTSMAEVRFAYVFTSAATGKSIQISGASQQSGTATENGDGTITFVSTFKGLPQKLNVANGPTLSRGAGYVTIIQTVDESTGDLISQVLSPLHGPHPSLADPNLFCDVIVPALT
jgi:hypothetical protein